MARGRKSGPSRMDMRRQSDAAEAREGDAEKPEDDTEDEDDDDEEDDEEESGEESEDGEAAAGGGDDDEAGGDDDDEDKPKKKAVKKKKEPAVKKPAVKRTRAVKEVRTKAVWVVLDNGSKALETFPFNQKAAAEEFLAKKIEEKKATFYMQLRKEALD